MRKKALVACLMLVLVSIPALAGDIHGAVNGGGGGVSDGSFVAPDEIKEFIEGDAKPILVSWLNNQQSLIRNLEDVKERKKQFLYPFLFSGNNVFEIVNDLKIQIEATRPCKDLNGDYRDGSITEKQDVICISTFRISQKTNHRTFRQETIGLIGHEVAHLVGIADHDDINQIQEVLVDEMYSLNWHSDLLRAPKRWLQETDWGIFRLLLSRVDQVLDGSKPLDRQSLKIIRMYFNKIHRESGATRTKDRLLFLDKKTDQMAIDEMVRLDILDDYVGWKDRTEKDHMRESYLRDLYSVFLSDDSVTVQEYYLRYVNWKGLPGEAWNAVLYNPLRKDGVKKNLQAFKKTMQEIKLHCSKFLSDQFSTL